ncbi:MAG: polysaccharide biosynthesis protein GtrA [Sphingomonadales bacterium 28-55-16]|nr:MAG: polysaccharide biosynthesis protein GtrA [Sphingomonadales bacterium 28-55-16]
MGNIFLRYVAASIGALAMDMGVFLALLEVGLLSIAASAVGYALGILTHWMLSSRAVFHDRVSDKGTAARSQQKAMFLASALLGLIMTVAIVGAGTAMGIDPRLAKIIAIILSFLLTYALRNIVIFRQLPPV